MKFIVKDLHDGDILEWTLEEVLEEINRDHSPDYTPYDKTDWKEGWDEWCEGYTYNLLNIKN